MRTKKALDGFGGNQAKRHTSSDGKRFLLLKNSQPHPHAFLQLVPAPDPISSPSVYFSSQPTLPPILKPPSSIDAYGIYNPPMTLPPSVPIDRTPENSTEYRG